MGGRGRRHPLNRLISGCLLASFVSVPVSGFIGHLVSSDAKAHSFEGPVFGSKAGSYEGNNLGKPFWKSGTCPETGMDSECQNEHYKITLYELPVGAELGSFEEDSSWAATVPSAVNKELKQLLLAQEPQSDNFPLDTIPEEAPAPEPQELPEEQDQENNDDPRF